MSLAKGEEPNSVKFVNGNIKGKNEKKWYTITENHIISAMKEDPKGLFVPWGKGEIIEGYGAKPGTIIRLSLLMFTTSKLTETRETYHIQLSDISLNETSGKWEVRADV